MQSQASCSTQWETLIGRILLEDIFFNKIVSSKKFVNFDILNSFSFRNRLSYYDSLSGNDLFEVGDLLSGSTAVSNLTFIIMYQEEEQVVRLYFFTIFSTIAKSQ